MMRMTQLQDPVKEAERVIEHASRQNIDLKLIGGLAVYFRCPSARSGQLSRHYVDLDFVCSRSQGAKLKDFFISLGYKPREVFNALQGDRRLIYNDLNNSRRVDIFLDVFEMCHKLDFSKRLSVDRDSYTIPIADLLLTKLQIIEYNAKDMNDMACIFLDHDISDTDDGNHVNGGYISEICAEQWGLYKTVTTNLSNLKAHVSAMNVDTGSKKLVIDRIDKLTGLIESRPKSLKWKMRARVGEKVKWYELPEMDKEVVDSGVMTTKQKTEN